MDCFRLNRSVFVFFVLMTSSISFADADPQELLKKADEGRFPRKDSVFQVTVKDFNGSKELRKQVFRILARPPLYSRVETIFPEKQKGRLLLMREDDLWFYTPDIRRPTRISLQQKLTGEVANGDIARTNYADDYSATLIGKSKINGQSAFELELVAKRKEVTYQKIRYFVKEDKLFMPMRAEFMTESGKLIKVAEFSAPQKILGRLRVTKMVITDGLNKSRKSELVFSKFKLQNHSDSLFNKDSLAD